MWPSAGMAAQLSLLRHPAVMLTFPVAGAGGGDMHDYVIVTRQGTFFSILIPEYIW